MVTGASTADLALVLVDARNGFVQQSRRHLFIASLLRIPHVIVCINKMDLVDYDEARVRHDLRRDPLLRLAAGDRRPVVHPDLGAGRATTSSSPPSTCSGTAARRCSTSSSTSQVTSDRNLIDVRLPVQWVIRPARATERTRLPRLRRQDGQRRAEGRRRGARSCPRARPRHVTSDRQPRPELAGGLSRRCRSPSSSPTTSTSRAGT